MTKLTRLQFLQRMLHNAEQNADVQRKQVERCKRMKRSSKDAEQFLAHWEWQARYWKEAIELEERIMLTDHNLSKLCAYSWQDAIAILKEQSVELTETYAGLELETVSLTVALCNGETTEAVCFPQYGQFYYEI